MIFFLIFLFFDDVDQVATNFRHIVKKSDEAGFSIQESKSKQLVPPVPDISQIDDSDIPPLE
jgi:hypothetical protein